MDQIATIGCTVGAIVASLLGLFLTAELNHRWLKSIGYTEEDIHHAYVASMDEFLYGD